MTNMLAIIVVASNLISFGLLFTYKRESGSRYRFECALVATILAAASFGQAVLLLLGQRQQPSLWEAVLSVVLAASLTRSKGNVACLLRPFHKDHHDEKSTT